MTAFDVSGLSRDDSLKLIEQLKAHIEEQATQEAAVNSVMEEDVHEYCEWTTEGRFDFHDDEFPAVYCTLWRSAPLEGDEQSIPSDFDENWVDGQADRRLEIEVYEGKVTIGLHTDKNRESNEICFDKGDFDHFDHETANWVYILRVNMEV